MRYRNLKTAMFGLFHRCEFVDRHSEEMTETIHEITRINTKQMANSSFDSLCRWGDFRFLCKAREYTFTRPTEYRFLLTRVLFLNCESKN